MNGPLVELADVEFRYGPRLALDLPALSISGGVTALLGPNGSGKSTLLRLVATVTAPSSGRLLIGGLDPADPAARTAVRRGLGYQTQDSALPGRMRVAAFVDYVATLKELPSARHRRQWTRWVLERTALDTEAGERIGSLSGGGRRRLALAQALIGMPRLLVLDEPLTSLDPDHRSQVVELILGTADTSTTVVATHHFDELAAVCDRVVVLHGGRVLHVGTPDSLAAHARGLVWETPTPEPGARCRAVGPGRYRCVAPSLPPDANAVEPTVHDGYLVAVARAEATVAGSPPGAPRT